tara:strand:- start:52 stop:1575 length:1524 start_codon:yes stop_codon:yes gene_type:complete
MTTTLPSKLAHNAATKAGGIWLTSPETGQTVNWAQAQHTIQEIVSYLHQLGLRPAEPVAIAAHNCIASALLFTAIASAGYLGTPLNLVSGTKAISYVLGHCQAKVLFCAPENKALIDEVLSEAHDEILIIPLHPETGPIWPENLKWAQAPTTDAPHPDSPALLMYTSGTTGNPKGVVLSHANLLAAGQNVVTAHKITSEDTGLCVLPTYHINGMCVTVMGTLVSASGLVIPYKFSVSSFWPQVKQHNVSWFSAVPTLFAYLLNDDVTPDINADRLRFARSASAPLPPETHRKFESRFGIPIIETMGLTETGAQILSNPLPPGERKIGSPGEAIGNEVIIADDQQNQVAAMVTGEILIRGANVMQGYLHQPEETAKTITTDGWLRTGDLGHMDVDGYVFVTGRMKELIIKGGENIAPREIDETLLEHDCVLEAAAFAVPCENYGQRVEACIRLKPGMLAAADSLIQHCKDRLGTFKSPENIHILEDLPKGPSGKVQRLKLHDLVYNKR